MQYAAAGANMNYQYEKDSETALVDQPLKTSFPSTPAFAASCASAASSRCSREAMAAVAEMAEAPEVSAAKSAFAKAFDVCQPVYLVHLAFLHAAQKFLRNSAEEAKPRDACWNSQSQAFLCWAETADAHYS
jgi:hypothetical protein